MQFMCVLSIIKTKMIFSKLYIITCYGVVISFKTPPYLLCFIWCSYTRSPQDGAIAPRPCTQLTPQIGRVALIFLTVTPENTRVCFDCLVSHSTQLIKLLLHSRWDALHFSNLFIFCLISFTTKSHGTMVFTRGRSMNAVKME